MIIKMKSKFIRLNNDFGGFYFHLSFSHVFLIGIKPKRVRNLYFTWEYAEILSYRTHFQHLKAMCNQAYVIVGFLESSCCLGPDYQFFKFFFHKF